MKNILFTSILALTFICENAISKNSYLLAPDGSNIQSSTPSHLGSIELGYGFDNVTNTVKPTIYTLGCEKRIGNHSQSFIYDLDANQSTLKNMVSGSAGVSGSAWGMDFDIDGTFAKQFISDEYSSTITLVYQENGKSLVLIPYKNNEKDSGNCSDSLDNNGAVTLTRLGEEAVLKSPTNLHNSFGNEVITSIHKGAYLMATFKIQYANKEDKMEATSQASFSGKNIEANADFIINSGISKNALSYEFSIVQSGGNQNNLIRASAYFGGLIPTEQGYTKTCDINTLQACESLMARAVNYVTGSGGFASTGIQPFITQLQDNNNYVTTGFSTHTWASSGFYEYVPNHGEWTVPLSTQAVIANIKKRYSINRMDNTKATSEKNTSIIQSTNFNMAILKNIATDCQDSPYGNTCSNSYKGNIPKLKSYTR